MSAECFAEGERQAEGRGKGEIKIALPAFAEMPLNDAGRRRETKSDSKHAVKNHATAGRLTAKIYGRPESPKSLNV
jgi:hypothetical protein